MDKYKNETTIETIETLYQEYDATVEHMGAALSIASPETEMSETGISILDDLEHFLRHPDHRDETEVLLLNTLGVIASLFATKAQ